MRTGRYLQCFDPHGRNLLLSLNTKPGQFYPVTFKHSEATSEERVENDNLKCVHRIKDLLREPSLPQYVRIIYGPLVIGGNKFDIDPRLQLIEKYEEKSLVACQIGDGQSPMFIEFPSNGTVKFEIYPLCKRNNFDRSYSNALRFCNENIETFKTQIQPIIGYSNDMTEVSNELGDTQTDTNEYTKESEERLACASRNNLRRSSNLLQSNISETEAISMRSAVSQLTDHGWFTERSQLWAMYCNLTRSRITRSRSYSDGEYSQWFCWCMPKQWQLQKCLRRYSESWRYTICWNFN